YELLFTAAPGRRAEVETAARQTGTRVTRIGAIEAEPGLRLRDEQGGLLDAQYLAFDHFR
ncbi:thiamine-phosphate kinase, partial [Rhizobium leguminosarum]